MTLEDEDSVSTDERSSSSDSSSVDDLGSMASFLAAMADAPVARARGALRPGQLVGGKYRVERAIGEGGMGVVYLARDEKLGREVALKVGRSLESAALARALGEAQTLAKLTHPNVIVVHEVGEIEGRVFVAMELVAGTARTWSEARARGYRPIVELYAAAGDGLLAAHAAGLIHRDFKPDNVLVGDDDRPRVADFGLAVASDETENATGEVVGTRAYMPPEQLEGREVDARADQFSFCASLWEALYDARPFGRGPRAARVPRHVDKALRRGLSPSKEQRFSSLAPLLSELRRDAGAEARRASIGAGLLLVIAAAIGVPLALRARSKQCEAGPAALAPIWTKARGDDLGRVFATSFGDALWSSLKPRIERYASAWIVAQEGACRATRLEGAQSEALLDRRIMCLAGARAQLGAVLDGYASGGRDALDHAAEALALLPDLTACDDIAALGNQPPLPEDLGARAAIASVQAELAVLRASAYRADVKLPTGKAEDLVAAATKTAWPPLIAQATHARGTWLRLTGDHERAREALRQASSLSLKCGDDDEAASAMIELSIDDAAQGQPAAAKPWIDLARAIWTRHGESPGLGAQLSEAEALYAFDLGHFEEGLARSQRMLELERKAHGDDALGEAKHHSLLCMAYVSGSRFDEGTREGRLALAAIEVAVGEAHPQTARYAARLAAAEIGAGELEVALSHARQALAIFEARSGPTDASVAQPLEWIGVALARRGDLAGARAAYERALTSLKARDAKPVIAELEEAAKLHAVLSKEPKEAAMSVVADLHLAYAAALWDGGGDRALALHEASLASDVFTALGADFESPKKAAEDWLVAHRQGRVSSGP